MASSAPLSAGKSILKKTQAPTLQRESSIDNGTQKLGTHHVQISHHLEWKISSEQSDIIKREYEINEREDRSVDVFTIARSNYQSVSRPTSIKTNPTYLVAIHKKFLHYDVENDNYYLLTVDDNQRVEKKKVEHAREVPNKPDIIKLPQNQILMDKWRVFVIADDLAPDSLVDLEAKPIAPRKKTIQVHPFSPQELKACFKAIRMQPYCFCLQRDQWSGTVRRDVLDLWITELESFRKRPTSYCRNTGSTKAIIYMALTYYARQKDLFGKEPSDDMKTKWNEIDDIYHCIIMTLHNVIKNHNMEIEILDIITNYSTINERFIEQNFPLTFHYYAPSIAKNINIYLSEKHKKNYPPFLIEALESNDNSLLHTSSEPQALPDTSPSRTRETYV